MRRALLLLSTMALALLLASGVALALNQINCASISQDPLTPKCLGTDQNDRIDGREVSDIIYADAGNDRVDASSGDDEVYGEAGTDKIEGGGRDDKLFGGANADILADFSDKDYDELGGGGGDDVLDAYDSNAGDTLHCGPGEDTAYFDRGKFAGATQDAVSNSCEHKVANEHPTN